MSQLGLVLVARSKNWGDALEGKYTVLKEVLGSIEKEKSNGELLAKFATLIYLDELSPLKLSRGRNTDIPRRQYDLIRTLKLYLRTSLNSEPNNRDLIRLAAIMASFRLGKNNQFNRKYLSQHLQYFERIDTDSSTLDLVIRVEKSIQSAKVKSKSEDYEIELQSKILNLFFTP